MGQVRTGVDKLEADALVSTMNHRLWTYGVGLDSARGPPREVAMIMLSLTATGKRLDEAPWPPGDLGREIEAE